MVLKKWIIQKCLLIPCLHDHFAVYSVVNGSLVWLFTKYFENIWKILALVGTYFSVKSYTEPNWVFIIYAQFFRSVPRVMLLIYSKNIYIAIYFQSISWLCIYWTPQLLCISILESRKSLFYHALEAKMNILGS